jgi:hypothetical protein
VFPFVPAGGSNDDVIESLDEWTARRDLSKGGAGEPGGAGLPMVPPS